MNKLLKLILFKIFVIFVANNSLIEFCNEYCIVEIKQGFQNKSEHKNKKAFTYQKD